MKDILPCYNECGIPSVMLQNQINQFTASYAFKYPDCNKMLWNCSKCPYNMNDENIMPIDDEDRGLVLKYYNRFNITPEDICHKELDDDQRIELIRSIFDNYRTVFRKEEERIIYTEAFRRLQYKTQVMINSASDDQRTRLLHSLEVQKISRKIAVALKANYELAETIAIAHDIGHAPFGHAGEYAIKEFLENSFVGSFSHAVQSVKVIDYLCSHRALKPKGLKGLGVSDYVLEGVLKHDSDSYSDNVASPAYRLQYNCERLYKPVGIDTSNNNLYQEDRVYIGGIESQIVCWADKIAYISHDWEEFVSVGLLETMLSRVNTIIISIDNFINHEYSEKYSYVCDEEKKFIKDFNTRFSSLKETYYDKAYNPDDFRTYSCFVKKLSSLVESFNIEVTNDSVNNEGFIKSNNCTMFSKEQYLCIFSFFRVALAWIRITEKLPPKIGGKMDIVFVINKYLNDTTSHRTVPRLIDLLVNNSKNKLCYDIEQSREDMINNCNLRFINNSLNENDIKNAVKSSFSVCFDADILRDVNYILGSFIKNEYINSTRVRHMSYQAYKIVTKLMNYYSKKSYMLPLKQRNAIDFECNNQKMIEIVKRTLMDYYMSIFQNENKEQADLLEGKLKVKKECFVNKTIDNDIPWEKLAKEAITKRVVADYVSGMTDRMAEKKYNEIMSSSTYWSKEYSERGTFNL